MVSNAAVKSARTASAAHATEAENRIAVPRKDVAAAPVSMGKSTTATVVVLPVSPAEMTRSVAPAFVRTEHAPPMRAIAF